MSDPLPKITDADSANKCMAVVAENLGRLVIASGFLEKRLESLRKEIEGYEAWVKRLAWAKEKGLDPDDYI